MKILVTGASGLLGSNLCRSLAMDGYQVRALVRRPLEHPLLSGLEIEQVSGELTDLESLKRAFSGCQQIYHVAGKVSYDRRDREALQRVNVTGTANILKAADAESVERVVVTSSTAAVGLGRCGDKPLNESAPFLGEFHRVPYMATKRAAEELALAHRNTEVVVVNPATIYGAGDVNLNTGELFIKARDGKAWFYPPGGMSVVSVGDVVSGHLLAMKKGRPSQRYILATADHSFQEIFSTVADVLSVKRPKVALPKLAHWPLSIGTSIFDATIGWTGKVPTLRPVVEIGFACRYFDGNKARQELGWQPKDDLRAMLAEAAEFYKQHVDGWKR